MMDNISLIISGNLTGFSRFYTSLNANDICSEAKFDFDNRNNLTFLNEGEKVYAISFAPTVVAVSLITRILDSFRRPGILVVTILMHRNEKIEQKVGGFGDSQNNKALYRLLNAVNEKFYEKNFVNGMLNQNPSVLMQDYYTDILKDYVLVSDRNQHYINGSINVESLNKRIGYVASTEDNIALYLSSPCRRSYEGYHHVFFGKNAPQNIEEEPEEVIIYSVLITNNKYRIPAVKLSDKIYNLRPDKGEIDFEKNYTYRQVLAGEAAPLIHASMNGETIEVTYRFGQEERTINFVFKDGLNVVPFEFIAPVIESDGSRRKIFSESFSFQGKEIYTRKKLISGNAEYQIKPESSDLDISSIKDGEKCYIDVEKCFEFRCNFEQCSKNKTIILTRFNADSIEIPNVRANAYAKLPGSPEDWEYTIESNDYESVSDNVATLLRTGRLNLVNKRNISPIQQTFSSDNSTSNELEPNRQKNYNSGVKSGGTLQVIGDGTQNSGSPVEKKKKNKLFFVRGALAIVILTVLLVFIGGLIWPGWFVNSTQGEDDSMISQNNDSITVTFSFVDSGGDKIMKGSFDKWVADSLIKGPRLTTSSKDAYSLNVKESEMYLSYIFRAPRDSAKTKIKMSLEFDDFSLSEYTGWLKQINDTTITIKLNVSMLEFITCATLDSIVKTKTPVDKDKLANILSPFSTGRFAYNESFYDKIKKLQETINKKNTSIADKNDSVGKTEGNNGDGNIDELLKELSTCDITWERCSAIKEALKKKKALNKKIGEITASKRIDALNDMKATLRKGYAKNDEFLGFQPDVTYLSVEQRKCIGRINWKNLKDKKYKNQFKDVKSLKDFENKYNIIFNSGK